MSWMNTLGCLTLVFAFTGQALGTAQVPELLQYNDKEYLLFSTPLESHLDPERSKRPWFKATYGITVGSGSGNERGYVATWQIEDSKLYLIEIDSWLCWRDLVHRLTSPCRRFEIEDIVGKPNDRGKHFARWFTGTLRVPLGKVLRYIHNGFSSVYERDMLFEVKNGVVVDPVIVDNRDKPLPSGLDGESSAWNNLKGQPVKRVFEFRLKMNETILPGSGLARTVVGASREQIELSLGKGENLEPAFHQAETDIVEYRSSRVIAVFGRDSNLLQAVYFHAGPQYVQPISTFKTDKGLNWYASIADIRAAYGKPLAENSGVYDALKTIQWRVLEYSGIEFRFENERLVRIGVLPTTYERLPVSAMFRIQFPFDHRPKPTSAVHRWLDHTDD